MRLYRDFQTQEEIDAEYNLEAVLDMSRYVAWFEVTSQHARSTLDSRLAVRYGPSLDETLDIFPARTASSPVLVFIHGGWWRSLSRHEFSLVALGPVARNVTVVVIDYSLCPKVSITEITRQSRAAVAWVRANIADYGGDPERIFVAGHSAGGHQVGMLGVTDWAGEYGFRTPPIAGCIPISGLFDLRPFRYSWLQPKLLLTHDTINRQSPLFHVENAPTHPPMLVTLGGEESAEFHRQSAEFADAWRAAGGSAEIFDQPDRDHITAIEGLADPGSELCDAMTRFIGTV